MSKRLDENLGSVGYDGLIVARHIRTCHIWYPNILCPILFLLRNLQ